MSDKHYCTGCGAEAEKQCSVCGEWRCADVHLTTGGWCCPQPAPDGGTRRGTWCVRNRIGDDGYVCEHGASDHYGTVRRVTYGNTTWSLDFTGGLTFRHCVAHLERNARNGWRWKEHGAPSKVASMKGKPSCFGGPQCGWCGVRDCAFHSFSGATYAGTCSNHSTGIGNEVTHCHNSRQARSCSHPGCWFKEHGECHEKVQVPATAKELAAQPWPSMAGAMVGTVPEKATDPIVMRDGALLTGKPKATTVRLVHVYCENAPPREVVESTMVTLDGKEGGQPVVVPLVFSARMKLEWERHLQEIAKLEACGRAPRRKTLGIELVAMATKGVKVPETPDLYGGTVDPVIGGGMVCRCAVCGGWMRRRPVSR